MGELLSERCRNLKEEKVALTLFLDSMVRMKTAWERLLSLFMAVEATRLFNQPVCRTWGATSTLCTYTRLHYLSLHVYVLLCLYCTYNVHVFK